MKKYMNYDEKETLNEKLNDWDLISCLDYNPQESFDVRYVSKILATYEGQNDGESWRWILELTNGEFVFLEGGCDYTGWDCQSWASSKVFDSVEDALEEANEVKGDILNMGLGQLVKVASGTYGNETNQVYLTLLKQIADNKVAQTKRQKVGEELGLSEDDSKYPIYREHTDDSPF